MEPETTRLAVCRLLNSTPGANAPEMAAWAISMLEAGEDGPNVRLLTAAESMDPWTIERTFQRAVEETGRESAFADDRRSDRLIAKACAEGLVSDDEIVRLVWWPSDTDNVCDGWGALEHDLDCLRTYGSHEWPYAAVLDQNAVVSNLRGELLRVFREWGLLNDDEATPA